MTQNNTLIRALVRIVKIFTPFPGLTKWGRASAATLSALTAVGIVKINTQTLVPDSWAEWVAILTTFAVIVIFSSAYSLQSQLDTLSDVEIRGKSSKLDLRPVLNHNGGLVTHNNVHAQVEFEIRNATASKLTLCPPKLSLRWRRPNGHWVTLKIESIRESWGLKQGAHFGDFDLLPVSRTTVRVSLLGELDSETFESLPSGEMLAITEFDIVGKLLRAEKTPLNWPVPTDKSS